MKKTAKAMALLTAASMIMSAFTPVYAASTDTDETAAVDWENGEYDFSIVAMYKTDERCEVVDMAKSYCDSGMILAVKEDSKYADTIKSLADCDGLKVAVKRVQLPIMWHRVSWMKIRMFLMRLFSIKIQLAVFPTFWQDVWM